MLHTKYNIEDLLHPLLSTRRSLAACQLTYILYCQILLSYDGLSHRRIFWQGHDDFDDGLFECAHGVVHIDSRSLHLDLLTTEEDARSRQRSLGASRDSQCSSSRISSRLSLRSSLHSSVLAPVSALTRLPYPILPPTHPHQRWPIASGSDSMPQHSRHSSSQRSLWSSYLPHAAPSL